MARPSPLTPPSARQVDFAAFCGQFVVLCRCLVGACACLHTPACTAVARVMASQGIVCAVRGPAVLRLHLVSPSLHWRVHPAQYTLSPSSSSVNSFVCLQFFAYTLHEPIGVVGQIIPWSECRPAGSSRVDGGGVGSSRVRVGTGSVAAAAVAAAGQSACADVKQRVWSLHGVLAAQGAPSLVPASFACDSQMLGQGGPVRLNFQFPDEPLSFPAPSVPPPLPCFLKTSRCSCLPGSAWHCWGCVCAAAA